jgi:hypothetical protein
LKICHLSPLCNDTKFVKLREKTNSS